MKKEIYPEYLPSDYFRYSDHTLTDQFITLIHDETDIDCIDLRPVVRSKKEMYPELFHKHDNHWNDIGAYFSYREIIKRISETQLLPAAIELSSFEIDTITWNSGSLAKVLGIEDVIDAKRLNLVPKFTPSANQLEKKYESPKRFPYSWAYERRYSVENDSLPRLMMINDSFGEYLYPLLAKHFSYSIFLFDSWEFKLHAKKVLEEKPDIFIFSIAESLIPNILDNLNREENNINF